MKNPVPVLLSRMCFSNGDVMVLRALMCTTPWLARWKTSIVFRSSSNKRGVCATRRGANTARKRIDKSRIRIRARDRTSLIGSCMRVFPFMFSSLPLLGRRIVAGTRSKHESKVVQIVWQVQFHLHVMPASIPCLVARVVTDGILPTHLLGNRDAILFTLLHCLWKIRPSSGSLGQFGQQLLEMIFVRALSEQIVLVEHADDVEGHALLAGALQDFLKAMRARVIVSIGDN